MLAPRRRLWANIEPALVSGQSEQAIHLERDVYQILVQCCMRWTNIMPAFAQHVVFRIIGQALSLTQTEPINQM